MLHSSGTSISFGRVSSSFSIVFLGVFPETTVSRLDVLLVVLSVSSISVSGEVSAVPNSYSSSSKNKQSVLFLTQTGHCLYCSLFLKMSLCLAMMTLATEEYGVFCTPHLNWFPSCNGGPEIFLRLFQHDVFERKNRSFVLGLLSFHLLLSSINCTPQPPTS